jgi:hypothetical protein
MEAMMEGVMEGLMEGVMVPVVVRGSPRVMIQKMNRC